MILFTVYTLNLLYTQYMLWMLTVLNFDYQILASKDLYPLQVSVSIYDRIFQACQIYISPIEPYFCMKKRDFSQHQALQLNEISLIKKHM